MMLQVFYSECAILLAAAAAIAATISSKNVWTASPF